MSEKLKPCPFCGGEAYFERMGTSRQSCIVECGRCGVRHESSDEYGRSGQSWNERQPTRAPQAVPALTDEQILDIGYAAKIVRSAGHWPLSERLVSIAAKQPSQEQPARQKYQD